MENSVADRTWSSAKLFVLKTNIAATNRNIPLIL